MPENFDDDSRVPDSEQQERASYAYVSENSHKNVKKKSHIGLGIVIFILCLAVVSGVSVQAYKIFSGKNPKVTEFTASERSANSEDEASETEAEDERYDIDYPTWLQTASRTDAKYLPDIVDEIEPSVVGVSATFEYKQTYMTWGGSTQTEVSKIGFTGTGIVMTEDGYIITNSHVVYDESDYRCGEAVEVSVLFYDESVCDASVVAYDRETDLAVLKVNQTGLTPATFGNSDDLRVGEMVIAVGNPLGFELFGTVTCGIVSALNREITINDKSMTLIQTDAAINNGNSGGPLLNDCGQVIGINSAKMSRSYSNSASIEGLGFAIPINEASVIINDLINYKYVKGRPQIGISSVDITESVSIYNNIPMGVYIYSIQEGSAAEKAGLKVKDIIIDIEGNVVTTAAELNRIKNQYSVGDTITLIVNRDGKDIEIELTLQEANGGTENEEFSPSVNDPDDLDET